MKLYVNRLLVNFLDRFQYFSKVIQTMNITSRTLGMLRTVGERFLLSRTPIQQHACGIKVRQWLKLRCPHCYFVNLNGRTYVLCKSHPRHNMMEPFDTKLYW